MWRHYRRFAAALALAGLASYAALLPGHLISQFAAQLRQADLSAFAGAVCHGGGGRSGPATQDANCPICKCHSGLAFGILNAPPSVLAFDGASAIGETARSAVVDATPLIARSRGPPFPT